MIFFSIIITPAVFKVLPREWMSQFLEYLFPIYFLWGMLFGVSAFLSRSMQFILIHNTAYWQLLILFVLVLGMAYARYIILPNIHKIKLAQNNARSDADNKVLSNQFKLLHKRCVHINIIVLFGLFLILYISLNSNL